MMEGFRRYPEYRDSGVEWLAEIPAHWEVVRLKAIASIRYGLGQPPRESKHGLPLIRATNIDNGRIVQSGLIHVDPSDVPVSRKPFLKRSEIIVVRSGAYTADSAIVREPYEGAVAGYDMVVTATGADPEFIAIALLSKYVRQDQLIVASTRSAQPHLNAEELGSAVFTLPPGPEQAAIAHFLDRQTEAIDRLVRKKERLIELVKEKRASLISHAVTRGLDPAAPMRDSGVESLGKIPAHWEVVRLKALSNMKSGESITATSIGASGPYPVFGGNGLRGYTSEFTHEGEHLLIGRQGALCGNVHVVEGRFWASEHAVVVSLSRSDDLRWLGAVLQTMDLNQHSVAAAQPGLAIDRVRDLWVPLPAPAEQRAIADFLDNETNQIDALVAKTQEAIGRLREYRDSVISAAVTGQIDVSGSMPYH